MNPFYNHNDGVPAQGSRGVSSLMRTEFDLIQAGFDTLAGYFGGVSSAILVSGTNGGIVNAYTITPTTALTAYGTNMLAILTPNATNTLASTINISGLGAKAILTIDGSAISAGDLVITVPTFLIYDGAAFRIFSVTKRYIDASIALKGAITGQSWSGTQDFTAATLTAATLPVGTNSTGVATMAALINQAFLTALPSQPGGPLTYNVVSTNGVISYSLASSTPDFLLINAGII